MILLLLLLGGLAVNLAMNTFPRLSLLALGAVPLFVTLLASNKTLAVIAPKVLFCFHPSGLCTLACVVFVSSTAPQLGPHSSYRSSVTPLCRLPACSIVGLNHSLVLSLLVYDVEQCVGVMHYEMDSHLPFHLAANSSGSIPAAIASTSTLPCASAYYQPRGFTTSVSPLSARYWRRDVFA